MQKRSVEIKWRYDSAPTRSSADMIALRYDQVAICWRCDRALGGLLIHDIPSKVFHSSVKMGVLGHLPNSLKSQIVRPGAFSDLSERFEIASAPKESGAFHLFPPPIFRRSQHLRKICNPHFLN